MLVVTTQVSGAWHVPARGPAAKSSARPKSCASSVTVFLWLRCTPSDKTSSRSPGRRSHALGAISPGPRPAQTLSHPN